MRACNNFSANSLVPTESSNNDRAAPELSDYQTYKPPTRDYDETVFNVVPYGDDHGDTSAVLHNAAGNLGISLAFNINELPVFSLWKSTDTMGQGYVTGLEPGTSWAYNRSYQRALNRVPTIGPKEQRRFDINLYFFARQSGGRPSAAKGTDYTEPASNETHETPILTPIVHTDSEMARDMVLQVRPASLAAFGIYNWFNGSDIPEAKLILLRPK